MMGLIRALKDWLGPKRRTPSSSQVLDAITAVQRACDQAVLRMDEHSTRASRRAVSRVKTAELSLLMRRSDIDAMDLYNAAEIDAYGDALDDLRRTVARFGASILALPAGDQVRETSLPLHAAYLKCYRLAAEMYARAASMAIGTALAGTLEATRRQFDASLLVAASSGARGSNADKARANALVEDAQRLAVEFQQLETRSRDAEARAQQHLKDATRALEEQGFIQVEP